MNKDDMIRELRQLNGELPLDHPSRHALHEALAALVSPCACGGREPLAVVVGHCGWRDMKWDGLDEWVLVLEETRTRDSPRRVKVVVLPASEEVSE